MLMLDCTIKLCTFPCQQSMCPEQSFSASETSVARYLIQFTPLPCQDFAKLLMLNTVGSSASFLKPLAALPNTPLPISTGGYQLQHKLQDKMYCSIADHAH